ncbi:MAG: hypothetical protein ACFCVG_04865 [Kineosporiaceae bacterium]
MVVNRRAELDADVAIPKIAVSAQFRPPKAAPDGRFLAETAITRP